MVPMLVTHDPWIVFWSWIRSGLGFSSTVPPSPTKAIRAQ